MGARDGAATRAAMEAHLEKAWKELRERLARVRPPRAAGTQPRGD